MAAIGKIFEEREDIGEGNAHKVVAGKSAYVWKIPKSTNTGTLEDANTCLEYMNRNFGEFMPQTRVLVQEGGGYLVVQKRINGKELYKIPESEFSQKTIQKLIDLLGRYIDVLSDEPFRMDLMGPIREGRHELNSTQNVSYIRKKIYILTHLKDILKSVNIMVDEKGDLFIVDNITKLFKLSLMGRLKQKVLMSAHRAAIRQLLD